MTKEVKKTKKKSDLKLSTVKKISKELDKTESYEITSGEYVGETVTFHPLFDEITIDELLTEYQKLFLEAQDNKLEISEEMFTYILNFLIIKYFTHFRKELPDTLLGKDEKSAGLLDHINYFRKTGLYRELLNEMFLPQEIQKVLGRLSTFLAEGLVANDLETEVQNKFQSLKLKNQFLFDQIRDLNVDDANTRKQIPEV